jgi:hypothetical protein
MFKYLKIYILKIKMNESIINGDHNNDINNFYYLLFISIL